MKETKINIFEYILILALTIVLIISTIQHKQLEKSYEILEEDYYNSQR